MGKVQGSPTSKTLDLVIYGFACVGFTGLMSLIVGSVGIRALKQRFSKDD
jgi:hypothetical protein